MPRSRPSSRLSTEWPSPSATRGASLAGAPEDKFPTIAGYSMLEHRIEASEPRIGRKFADIPPTAIIGSRWLLSEPERSASRSTPGRMVQDQQWCTTAQRPSSPRACGFRDSDSTPWQSLKNASSPMTLRSAWRAMGPRTLDRIEEMRSAGVDHGDLPQGVVVGQTLVCAIQGVIALRPPRRSLAPLGPRAYPSLMKMCSTAAQ